jgi:hypothetical protein
MGNSSERSVFSAGDCPITPGAEVCLFLVSKASGNLFLLCPMCGMGWNDPAELRDAWVGPPLPAEVAWAMIAERSLEKLAPAGARIATREDIESGGLGASIVEELPYAEFALLLEDAHIE